MFKSLLKDFFSNWWDSPKENANTISHDEFCKSFSLAIYDSNYQQTKELLSALSNDQLTQALFNENVVVENVFRKIFNFLSWMKLQFISVKWINGESYKRELMQKFGDLYWSRHLEVMKKNYRSFDKEYLMLEIQADYKFYTEAYNNFIKKSADQKDTKHLTDYVDMILGRFFADSYDPLKGYLQNVLVCMHVVNHLSATNKLVEEFKLEYQITKDSIILKSHD